jgi:UDP-glucose 4-epimerase
VTTAVVGADGFIGGHLCGALRRAGSRVLQMPRRAGVERLREADVVFWAAGSITPALATSRPERVDLDHAALVGALDECKRGGRRPLFVLLSSGGTVYQPDLPPFSERSPIGPTGAYGRAKIAQERAVQEARDTVLPVIARLSNVYGPRQRAEGGLGVVCHWLDAVAGGRPVRLLGDPDTRRDFVFVHDVTAALVAMQRLRPAGEVINIGAGGPTSLGELLHLVQSTVDLPVVVERGARRTFDRQDVWLDVRHAEQTLGWRPATGLRDGLAVTWAWRSGREVTHAAQR